MSRRARAVVPAVEADPPTGAAPRPGGPGFLVPERRARIDAVVAGRTRTLTVVMEAFCDPQNVNAVLRTCEAFGIQELHAIEGPMKPYDRNKKISQNADKWLDVHRWKSTAECLGHLRDQGFAIYVTHLDPGTRPLGELSFAGKAALVFGSESRESTTQSLARCPNSTTSGESLKSCWTWYWRPLRTMALTCSLSLSDSRKRRRTRKWR